MTGLGVLDEIRPADHFDSDAVVPARPGSRAPSTLATSHRRSSSLSGLSQVVTEMAKMSRDRAKREADDNPTSTTLTALAQTYASLEQRDEAIGAAYRALELALAVENSNGLVGDPVSIRLAAEVLLRFDETGHAHDFLRRAPRTRSLRIMLAMIAMQNGDGDRALKEIEGMGGSLVEAVRGYILATIGEYQKAVGHLRAALRDQPDDPDSLFNLSLSLWHIGARRKATRVALRATRVAPGRKDISLHYMNLLLNQGELDAVDAEVRLLKAQEVIEDSDFLMVQAHALIEKGEIGRAISKMALAAEAAGREGNDVAHGEALADLAVLKYEAGRITREEVVRQLEGLLRKFPKNDALVVHYARFASSASQAPFLQSCVEEVRSTTSALRLAYLRHQIALLEGDNDAAAAAATEWFTHEPRNPMAAAAAIVALGIGVERWDEAAILAREALAIFPSDPVIVNNSAYVLAMSGHAQEAIELLDPIAGDDFVMKATLGLSHLANGDFEKGMRLYREAADRAERADPVWRSLMTGYQALVVRQLGLLDSQPGSVIGALALVPFSPPSDWRDRPDFLRLWGVAQRNGYGWPLVL